MGMYVRTYWITRSWGSICVRDARILRMTSYVLTAAALPTYVRTYVRIYMEISLEDKEYLPTNLNIMCFIRVNQAKQWNCWDTGYARRYMATWLAIAPPPPLSSPSLADAIAIAIATTIAIAIAISIATAVAVAIAIATTI